MSARLTHQQEFTLVMATRLLARHGQVLSAFEAELIVEVGQRWLEARAMAIVTDAEWLVIEPAAQAMADDARLPASVRIAA